MVRWQCGGSVSDSLRQQPITVSVPADGKWHPVIVNGVKVADMKIPKP